MRQLVCEGHFSDRDTDVGTFGFGRVWSLATHSLPPPRPSDLSAGFPFRSPPSAGKNVSVCAIPERNTCRNTCRHLPPPAKSNDDTCRHLLTEFLAPANICRVELCACWVAWRVWKVLFSMVDILSQALETVFPISHQGYRVDNQHPGASLQSTQPQEQPPFVLHTMALCARARLCAGGQ
jgi:hypothetical protein